MIVDPEKPEKLKFNPNHYNEETFRVNHASVCRSRLNSICCVAFDCVCMPFKTHLMRKKIVIKSIDMVCLNVL